MTQRFRMKLVVLSRPRFLREGYHHVQLLADFLRLDDTHRFVPSQAVALAVKIFVTLRARFIFRKVRAVAPSSELRADRRRYHGRKGLDMP
jgi:hypothetical protein